VTSFGGLMVARSFLGVFEGGAMPGMAFFLSTFYRREELLFRIGIYVSAASMAGAFGGLLATGLSKIPAWGTDAALIHTWRNIFFFEGIITMIVGLLAPIWMPHSPETAKFLTPRERHIAAARLVIEHKANPAEKVKLAHIRRAIFCIHNYTCALGFFLINITVQGLSVFMPTILNDLGWKAITAQLMTVPVYAAACLMAIAVAYVSDKTKRRGVYLAAFSTLSLIGFALLRWHTGKNIRYMAVFFVCVGAFPGGPGFLSWGINSESKPNPEKTISRGLVLMMTLQTLPARQSEPYRVPTSSLLEPVVESLRRKLPLLPSQDVIPHTDTQHSWTYVKSDGPKYHTGHTINLVGQACTVLLSIFGILYCSWENRQRAAGKRDRRLDGLSPQEEMDLGYRHPSFRYMT